MRMRLALLLSFSHACARIVSAIADVRCGGVGRSYSSHKARITEALNTPDIIQVKCVAILHSGVAWLIGARDGLQFGRHKKS